MLIRFQTYYLRVNSKNGIVAKVSSIPASFIEIHASVPAPRKLPVTTVILYFIIGLLKRKLRLSIIVVSEKIIPPLFNLLYKFQTNMQLCI